MAVFFVCFQILILACTSMHVEREDSVLEISTPDPDHLGSDSGSIIY